MKINYYIGEGPENDALCMEVRRLVAQREQARQKLADDYHAEGVYCSGCHIKGLAFREEVDLPYLKLEAVSYEGFGYEPCGDTREGQELIHRLEEQALHFDSRAYICKKLNIFRVQTEGRKVYETAAYFSFGKILVSIPGQKDRFDFPKLPDWFYEVNEDEWYSAKG